MYYWSKDTKDIWYITRDYFKETWEKMSRNTFFNTAAHRHIGIISEVSCDTEDGSNAAENVALPS